MNKLKLLSILLGLIGFSSCFKVNNNVHKQGLNINLLSFKTIEEQADDSVKKRTKYIMVDLYNNQDTSIFLTDSLMLYPEMVYQYREEELIGKSASESLAKPLIEIFPYDRDTFYMSPIFRNTEPDANIFDIFICYYLSPVITEDKKCKKLKYKIEGYELEKIE